MKRYLLYFFFLILGPEIHALYKDPEFPIVVFNNLNRDLNVSWLLSSGKKVTKVIPPEKKIEVITFERLSEDAKMRFEVEGTLLRWTAAAVELDKPELLKQAYKLHLGRDESLCMTISQSRLFLTVAYARQASTQKSQDLGSLLDQFTGFDSYPDLKKCLTEERILGFKSWKTPFYSQEDGSLMATAEDIYRCILGVTKGYDHSAIKNAYIFLKLRYEDDQRSTDEKKKRRAKRILDLGQKAYQGLDRALRDQAEAQKTEPKVLAVGE